MFPGGKGGRCVGLTTLPPSCADCLEIWEPQFPGTLRACPGLQWDCFTFKVCKSVHHHTIPINQPTRCNNFSSLLIDVYVQLNMFRASSCPLSGAHNYSSSLWFYRWSVVIAVLLVVVGQTGPTTINSTAISTLRR